MNIKFFWEIQTKQMHPPLAVKNHIPFSKWWQTLWKMLSFYWEGKSLLFRFPCKESVHSRERGKKFMGMTKYKTIWTNCWIVVFCPDFDNCVLLGFILTIWFFKYFQAKFQEVVITSWSIPKMITLTICDYISHVWMTNCDAALGW